MAPNNTTTSSTTNQKSTDGQANHAANGSKEQVVQLDPSKIPSLWNKDEEKAACGVGFIVNIYGKATNKVGQFKWNFECCNAQSRDGVYSCCTIRK